MSNAEPMALRDRLERYLGVGLGSSGNDARGHSYSESDLTPAQRRRAWHKAHRNGERGSDSEVLYGRKGHATPRRTDAVRGSIAGHRFLEARRA